MLLSVNLSVITLISGLFFSQEALSKGKYSTADEINCLAKMIYIEAGSNAEPQAGKIGVAFAAINRTKDDYFPDTICKNVQKHNGVGYEFPWYAKRKYRAILNDRTLHTRNENYAKIYKLAEHVFYNHKRMDDPTNGAMFFRSTAVRFHNMKLKRTVQLGHHVFFKPKKGKL